MTYLENSGPVEVEAELILTRPNSEGFALSYTKTKYISECHKQINKGSKYFLHLGRIRWV